MAYLLEPGVKSAKVGGQEIRAAGLKRRGDYTGRGEIMSQVRQG